MRYIGPVLRSQSEINLSTFGPVWSDDRGERDRAIEQRIEHRVDHRAIDCTSGRWRNSIHESGHAAAAVCYGVEIVTAAVGHGPPERPDLGGFIRTREYDDPVGICVVDVAGGAAERVFFGTGDAESEGDRANVLANVYRIRDVAPDIAADLIAHFKLVARDLVEVNRAAIERLAAELYCRGELSGDEAARILGRIERPPFRPIRWSDPLLNRGPASAGVVLRTDGSVGWARS